MEEHVQDATRLLVVDTNAEEADRLVNVFRDAGQTTRAHHITCTETLEKAFLEKQRWDLLVISKLPDGLSLDALLESIEHQSADIPIIIIADYKDGNERMEYLRKGIKAVVPSDQQEMLLLKAGQEIENLYIRRNYRRMSIALNESERQRRLLLDDEIDAIIYLNDGIIRYANPAFCDLLGRDKEYSFEGKSFADIVVDADNEQVSAFLESMEETGQALGVLQCTISLDQDEPLPIRAIIKPTSYNGAFSLSLQIRLTDAPVMDHVAEEEIVAHVELTGLATKEDFRQLLDISIQQIATGKRQATLLHASIDGLAEIHKDKGVRVSQKLEKMVGDQILDVLGTEHAAASLGGGRFSLLLHLGGEAGIHEVVDKVIKQVSSISLDDKAVNISLSMGAIVLGDTGKDAETLQIRAKEACAQSEKKGGGQLSYYKPRKVKTVKSVEKHLAVMLSQAMKTGALKLYYQPVVSLKGEESNYYDVLFSMTDIRGREHKAASFKTKLDNEKLWMRVDRWQFAEASKVLLEKRKEGQDIRVFIHLGGSALTDKTFIPWISSAVQQSGLPTSSIVLDLSEANVTRNGKAASAFFESAKQIGCHTSISEFGCSASPLDIIDSVNADFIKIDASFTKDLTTEGQGDEFKEVLEELTEKGKQIVVPDVQNTAGLASLWHHGVDFVQGQFLQAPQEVMNYSFDSDF